MTSHQHPDNLTLITGGTGKTGRRIADRLSARKADSDRLTRRVARVRLG